MSEPDLKKQKFTVQKNTQSNVQSEHQQQSCQHFVTRKKRLCRITVAKGEIYCGEHLPLKPSTDQTSTAIRENGQDDARKRVLCPLDPKHTVYGRNLRKHLTICNAKVTEQPDYIVPGLNAGPPSNEDNSNAAKKEFKLSEIDSSVLASIIAKVNQIYDECHSAYSIDDLYLSHSLLDTEIQNKERGHETLKHLMQTASLLGHLEHLKLLQNDETAFIEFGAGKGQVAFWLAKAVEHLSQSSILLIDKASLRHKKDNKVKDTHCVHRIRADISEFDIRKLDLLQRAKHIVGVSKHLCGAATDFAIRCILNGNENDRSDGKTEAFIIALCCHHRCAWQPFVGKEFFQKHGVTIDEFTIISKMVGWAVCGTGLSRERRMELEDQGKGTNLVYCM